MRKELEKELKSLATPQRAKVSQSFFKTGKGQYGEGDIFIGITVPETRKRAKKYVNLSLEDIQYFLSSKIHEFRLTAVLVLLYQFETANKEKQEEIFHFYLKNTSQINNWDLVDVSAPNIIGRFLEHRPREILYTLAKSNQLWEKRISIVATLAFIRKNQFEDTLKISELFLHETHDLLHKATGWMLREVGKKDEKVLEAFLQKYASSMPRTMLRYAIERFPKDKRSFYLAQKL